MKSLIKARIKWLIPLLIFACFFTTCKKDDDLLDAYASYRLEIQPIRLFTANGEIQDQGFISDFVIRHTSSHNFQTFITNYDTIIDVTDQIKIEYLSSNTTMFTYFDESTNRNVVEKDNLLYFEASDTTTLYHPIGMDSTLADFFENLPTYRPLYSEFHALPLSTGWRGFTRFRHCYFLQKKNKELYYPSYLILHVRYYDPGIPEQMRIFGFNDDFNTGVYQYLIEGDTIAVQQSATILKSNDI